MSSYVVKKERCPKCAGLGKDTKGDNLVSYSDGHSYCFSCGYTLNGDGAKLSQYYKNNQPLTFPKHEVFLPSDCSFDYPQQAVEWVGQYEIEKPTLMKHRVMWSQSKERLCFPIIGSENEFLAYVGRNFNRSKGEPKWISFGNLNDTLHIIGVDNQPLVMCEDIVSAIKLSKFVQAMPLFGVHIGETRFKRIYRTIQKGLQCIIWLDPDMRIKAVKQSALGSSMGLNMRTLFTDKDPKEHSYDELKCLLAVCN